MDIVTWAKTAAIGAVKVYYIDDGRRCRDAAAFDTAYRAYERGLVFLCQRRIRKGPRSGQLAYEARRISPEADARLAVFSRKMVIEDYRATGGSVRRAS